MCGSLLACMIRTDSTTRSTRSPGCSHADGVKRLGTGNHPLPSWRATCLACVVLSRAKCRPMHIAFSFRKPQRRKTLLHLFRGRSKGSQGLKDSRIPRIIPITPANGVMATNRIDCGAELIGPMVPLGIHGGDAIRTLAGRGLAEYG